jgi:hypothetical protein
MNSARKLVSRTEGQLSPLLLRQRPSELASAGTAGPELDDLQADHLLGRASDLVLLEDEPTVQPELPADVLARLRAPRVPAFRHHASALGKGMVPLVLRWVASVTMASWLVVAAAQGLS